MHEVKLAGLFCLANAIVLTLLVGTACGLLFFGGLHLIVTNLPRLA